MQKENPLTLVEIRAKMPNVAHSLGPFLKSEKFVKLTKNKQDSAKLSQELSYNFSPKYKEKMDEIKKPNPFEPPATYSKN